jgi:hypothetical protein
MHWSLSVQPGDLVRITRASIGVPKDTIGLIVKARAHDDPTFPEPDEVYTLFHVQLIGMRVRGLNGKVRRYLAQDLRKVK